MAKYINKTKVSNKLLNNVNLGGKTGILNKFKIKSELIDLLSCIKLILLH